MCARNTVIAAFILAAAVPAAAQTRSGAAVYEDACKVCHVAGELGAPKLGDAKAWRPLIREGQAAL
jgi:cytochrome c5